IAFPRGGLLAFTVVLCGMMTAALPAEALPGFWRYGIAPWVPQPMIAGGLRDILYVGADLMPRGSGGLALIGRSGLVLLVIAGLIPRRTSTTPLSIPVTGAAPA